MSKNQPISVTHPQLISELHPTKNYRLNPENYSKGSHKKVWWKCPVAEDHEWEAAIYSRTGGQNCPFCAGQKVAKSNSLVTTHPSLANEWHTTKNKNLTPYLVSAGSAKKVWWKCSEGDDHEWQATIYSRVNGNGCSVCAGLTVVKSNSLTYRFPQIAKEWHPTKNGELSPHNIYHGSSKEVWWKCPKGDDHEWKCSVFQRTNVGTGCSVCAGRKVVDSNSLQTTHPELAKQWDFSKNGKLTPHDITAGSDKIVWWKCPEGDDHEWQVAPSHRSRGSGCPICSNNKLVKSNSLAVTFPELASEWHPTKNGTLKPTDVQSKSNKKVWWQCKIDSKHEWQAQVNNRHKAGCPYCAGLGVSRIELRIYSELLWIFGDVQHQKKIHKRELDIFIPSLNIGVEYDGYHWHRSSLAKDKNKNAALASKGITVVRIRESGLSQVDESDLVYNPKSSELDLIIELVKQISSLMPKSESPLKKMQQYIYEARLQNKDYTKFLVDWYPKPVPGNSLKDVYPEIANQWHPTKNGHLAPRDVAPHAGLKVWWQCENGHSWETTIDHRTRQSGGTSCPTCYKQSERIQKISNQNLLATRHPEHVSQWHPTKNGDLKPETVGHQSHRKVWWKCKMGHEWKARIDSRSNGNGCPVCRIKK